MDIQELESRCKEELSHSFAKYVEASPSLILEIIERLRAAEQERDQLKDEADTLRVQLQAIGDQEPVAFCYPWDLEKLRTNECFINAFSIPVGCPEGESTVRLYDQKPIIHAWPNVPYAELVKHNHAVALELESLRAQMRESLAKFHAATRCHPNAVQTLLEEGIEILTQIAPGASRFSAPTRSFKTLWESINGAGTWASNPWVWVVEFKKLEGMK